MLQPLSTFGSRYFHQLKATAPCGFWAKSPHFGGLQPNAALWNHRSQLSRLGWNRFSEKCRFDWPFIDLLLRMLSRVFKSISTTQCEPSSTIALASNSTLTPRPSTARCKGLRPCGSPGCTARDIWKNHLAALRKRIFVTAEPRNEENTLRGGRWSTAKPLASNASNAGAPQWAAWWMAKAWNGDGKVEQSSSWCSSMHLRSANIGRDEHPKWQQWQTTFTIYSRDHTSELHRTIAFHIEHILLVKEDLLDSWELI